MKSLYDVLELNKNCSRNEILKAYYRLAKTLHPDTNPDADPKAFLELLNAYKILSDPKKREEYDKYGTTSETEDVETAAVEMLNAYIQFYVHALGVGITQIDLIAKMVKRFNELVTEQNTFIHELKQKLIGIAAAKARVMRINPEIPDYFGNVINTEINDINDSIKLVERDREIYQTCIAMLGNYAWSQS